MSVQLAFLSATPVFTTSSKPYRRSICRAAATPPPPQKDAPPSPPTRKKVTPTPAPPTFFEILTERTLDTVDDINMHYGRLFKREPPVVEAPPKKPRIVVLGSGWGAHSFVKVAATEEYDVTVVSPRNFYFFTPLLAATAVGTIEFRSIVDPIRRANPFVAFYEAACTEIDVERSEVICVPVRSNGNNTAEFRLPYDYLLIAVGERAGTFGVPGVRENAYFLKELTDSVKLRRAIVSAFEVAALPGKTEQEKRSKLHFVVVGGGPTGCEYAGELSDFLLNDLFTKFSHLQQFVSVTLLQSRNAILTSFEANLQSRALDNFEGRRVNVRLNARVARVTPDMVELKDGTEIEYGVLVWAAGNSPRDVTVRLAEHINEVAINGDQPQPKGARKLRVDSWLRVLGTDRVFAFGDCSYIENGPLPATAQVAGQQGAYLARVFRKWDKIRRETEMKTRNGDIESELSMGVDKWAEKLKPFSFLSLGAMTYIGDQKAMVQFDTREDQPNIGFSGFISYLLWLSTYAVRVGERRFQVAKQLLVLT